MTMSRCSCVCPWRGVVRFEKKHWIRASFSHWYCSFATYDCDQHDIAVQVLLRQ